MGKRLERRSQRDWEVKERGKTHWSFSSGLEDVTVTGGEGYNGTKERKRQTTCEMHFGDCIPGLLMRLRERKSQGVCCLEAL